LPAAIDKMQGAMVHPYLPSEGEVKKTWRDIDLIIFLS
jgi:hypothetical protein